ncbi:MAG: right-handed parallel beta-helix repeat-containing protein [Candidatus Tectomicrobia bacterium]|nr:right-handed parallel beta-helix repeat-containing protein [Candidatus Tectomicrobia bacterium]
MKFTILKLSMIFFIFVLITPLHAAQFTVNSSSEFSNAVKKANPGDEIVIQNGIYKGWGEVTIDKDDITIRAEKQHQTIFDGNDYKFIIKGNKVTLQGLSFKNNSKNQKDGVIEFRGAKNSRVTECEFLHLKNQTPIIGVRSDGKNHSKNNRVDHNEFHDSIDSVIFYVYVKTGEEPFQNSFDHNLVQGCTSGKKNIMAIRVGNWAGRALYRDDTIVDNNKFIQCQTPWDLFHIKGSGIKIRNNYIEESTTIKIRQGTHAVITGNMIIGTFAISEFQTGDVALRVQGHHAKIYNNIIDGQNKLKRGIALSWGSGDAVSGNNHYVSAHDNEIFNNTVLNCREDSIYLGDGKNRSSDTGRRNKAPHDNQIKNNIISMSRGTLVNLGEANDNVVSHNLFHATGSASIGTKGKSDIVGDPKFASASDGNYQLRADSPAIDNGQTLANVAVDRNGNKRPSERAHDIGAFEFQLLQQKIVGGKTYAVQLLIEENFANLDNWLVEMKNPGKVKVADNILQWDARNSMGTMWNKTLVHGPSLIEYDVQNLDGMNNLNAIFYGSIIKKDQEVLLETTHQRTGEYDEYHLFPNYIITYLSKDPSTDISTWRIRFRKNPGFNLLSEQSISKRVSSREWQHLTYVFEQNGSMSLYVDNRLVHTERDTKTPYRLGYHALRTWETHLSYKNFKIYQIVPSSLPDPITIGRPEQLRIIETAEGR